MNSESPDAAPTWVARMRVLTTEGHHLVLLERGSLDSSLVGSHWNAIKRFRNTGDRQAVLVFCDEVIAGWDPETEQEVVYVLASDLDQIKRWVWQGELDEADPYAELEGGGYA